MAEKRINVGARIATSGRLRGAFRVNEGLYESVRRNRTQRNLTAFRSAGPRGAVEAIAERVGAAEAKAVAAMDAVQRGGGAATLNRVPMWCVKDGPIELVRTTPDTLMPEDFDPVLFALCRAWGAEFLAAGDNEGSANAGQADTDLLPSAEGEVRITVLRLDVTPDADEPGVNGGTIDIDFYDQETAGVHAFVESHATTGVTTEGELTAADMNDEMDATFNHPSVGKTQMYVHLAVRPATISRVVPSCAILLNPAAASAGEAQVYDDRNILIDWRSLGGSNINVYCEAITPFSPGWNAYVAFCRERGYTRQ